MPTIPAVKAKTEGLQILRPSWATQSEPKLEKQGRNINQYYHMVFKRISDEKTNSKGALKHVTLFKKHEYTIL